jgi:hypothetical protein
MPRQLWRLLDAGLALVFSRMGWFLVALSMPMGAALTQPLEPFGMAAMAFGYTAPIATALWLYGRYYVPKAVRQPEQRYAPPPPPPPKPRAPEPPPVTVFPLLKLRAPFTRAELAAAFRRRSMELHPDHGGNAALFCMLIAERDRALRVAK